MHTPAAQKSLISLEEQDRCIATISDLLIPAYSFLFDSGSAEGHWTEARSTALAGMCVQWAEPGDSPWCLTVKQWILGSQMSTGAAAGSWGEEIWDTSMSVLALKHFSVPSTAPTIERAINWIADLYSVNGRGNWHDEPWETCWALIAILTCGIVPDRIAVIDPLEWLQTFQDENGRIIAPHYTAYFVLICSLLPKVNVEIAAREKLAAASRRASDFLLGMLKKSDPGRLWTGEAWSNGQILWALARTDVFPFEDDRLVSKVLSWFKKGQQPAGNWSDVEDTASAILGLIHLLEGLFALAERSDARIRVRNHLQRTILVPPLQLNLPFFQRREKIDCISINFTRKRRRLLTRTGLGVTALATLAQLVDFAWNHWIK